MEKFINKQFVIIIRGIPGSGKTTLAKSIVKKFMEHDKLLVHCEADPFRINDKGEYHFDPLTDIECQNKCFKKFKDAIDSGLSAIVSNCFLQKKDMLHYVNYLKSMDIKYFIVRTENAYQNIHGVSDEMIFNMKKKFKPIDEEIVASKFNKILYDIEGFEL